jgi:fengycin family lipopeptide synthetase E
MALDLLECDWRAERQGGERRSHSPSKLLVLSFVFPGEKWQVWDGLLTARSKYMDNELLSEIAINSSIVDRFEDVARRVPDRLAVSDAQRSMSYSQLAEQVGRLGTIIAAATEDCPGPIGIFCRNDVRYPTAMLGILAARRGYVSMDIDHPVERTRLIASDAVLSAVVTSPDQLDGVNSLFPPGVRVIDLDTTHCSVGRSRAFQRPTPEDLADILYTSGSTGTPKGVYQNHRGRLYAILQRTRMLNITYNDRLALCFPPSTVSGVRVILTALLNGAWLHILPPAHWKLSGLAEQIHTRAITILQIVPTLFRHLTAELGNQERFSSLRIVHLTSERVEWSDLDLVRRYCGPDTVLTVALGSTESSGSYAQWAVNADVRENSSRLPVCREVADFEVTIVDPEGRPVEDGAIGEFIISSPYLALGYWRDPDLTQNVFSGHTLQTIKT